MAREARRGGAEQSAEGYCQSYWASVPFAVLALDAERRVIHATPAAEALIGRSERQMHGRDLAQIFGAEAALTHLVSQALQDRRSRTHYDLLLAAPPSMAPQRCHVFVSFLAVLPERESAVEAGRKPVALLTIQEITPAMSLERSTATPRAAARSLAALAGMLAHEIRNPLAGISGAAQLLSMTLHAEDQSLVQLIEDEVTRINALVARVEQAGDQRPLSLEPVNLNQLLEEMRLAMEPLRPAGVRVEPLYDPSLPDAAGDAGLLMQALRNILKNAYEAVSARHGRVQIRSTYNSGLSAPRRREGGHAHRPDLPLQIDITDNGPGIDEGRALEIFEPFVTTKDASMEKGSGLGLALVSKVISDHGGTVYCIPQEAGCTFRINLPLWAGPKASAAQA